MGFKIGDIIRNTIPGCNTATQRYVVVGYCEIGYVVVDALCARGKLIIPFNQKILYGRDDTYIIDDGTAFKEGPCVDDTYVEAYGLPNEWRYSLRNK